MGVKTIDYGVLLADIFGLVDGYNVDLHYPLDTDADREDARNVTANMATDWIFACPTRSLSRAVSDVAPVYLYQFNHSLSFGVQAWGPNYTECFGHVCHGTELPFLFGFLQDLFQFDTDEAALHKSLMQAWGNFVHSADPSSGAAAGVQLSHPGRRIIRPTTP